MSEFQREFFEELWYDTTTNGAKSVLYEYLREEKNAQIPVALKILEYEELLGRDVSEKRSDLMKTKEYEIWMKTREKTKSVTKKSRKKASENPCVNLICKYYDYKIKEIMWEKEGKTYEQKAFRNDFLDDIKNGIEEEKKIINREKKEPLLAISKAKKDGGEAELENAMEQVIGAYLSADAKQFMYDVGYPLTTDPEADKKKNLKRTPVKRVPMKLIDLYFQRKNFSLDVAGSSAEILCEKAKLGGDLYDEFEQVFNYAKENKMKKIVIPLLIDNQSGSGLYVLGDEYLEGWKKGTAEWGKLQKILTIHPRKTVLDDLRVDIKQKGDTQVKTYIVNRNVQSKQEKRDTLPCCYAIIKFMNLSIYEKNEWTNEENYYWAAYSIANAMEDMGNDNVEEVIFSDLHKALDCYYGQLKIEPDGLESDLYEYFRDVNIVDKNSDWQSIPKRFWKFFDMSDDYFMIELEREEEERAYNEQVMEKRTPNRKKLLNNPKYSLN